MSGKSSYLAIAAHHSLVAVEQRGSGSVSGFQVDVTPYTGKAVALLDVTAVSGGTPTLAVKLQHCDTQGGTFTDIPGAAFAVVTTASGVQRLVIDVDHTKRFVTAVGTAAGSTPVYTWGVQLVALRKYDGLLLDNEWEGESMSLDDELERTLLITRSFDAAPILERGTAGSATTVGGVGLKLATGTGANRIREVHLAGNAGGDIFFEAPDNSDWFQYRMECAAHIGPYQPTIVGGLATATTFAGIELGTMLSNAPFPSAPANAVCQLRWNYGLLRWELLSAPGDGATPAVVVPLTGVVSHVDGGGDRIRLIWDPYTPRVLAMVNGVVGAQIADPAALPQFGNFLNSDIMFGAFVTSGTNASAFTEAWISAVHIKAYDLWRGNPAPFWY